MKLLLRTFLFVSLFAAAPLPALAWGLTGHSIISGAAMAALPQSIPQFLRSPTAAWQVRMLGPEMDRLKGAGREWDADEDPGHYVDIDDSGMVAGVVTISDLPASRREYDTALRTKGTNQYQQGFLPYAIIDGEEQLARDFALWRVDVAGVRGAATPADRQWFDKDRQLRELLIVRDIGVWSHFVGDASQPLHVSIHFNGWGNYANPKNYSDSRTLHARFESDFVRAHARADAVQAKVGPYIPCSCTIEQHVATYLAATLARMPAVYELEGQDAFTKATRAAVDLMESQLAAGASMLRDMIIEAWNESASAKVGYPAVSVADIEGGKLVPKPAMFGE